MSAQTAFRVLEITLQNWLSPILCWTINIKDFCSWQPKLCIQGCKDSVALLWICLCHLRNLHALMTMINLCFKSTNASVRAELRGFYSTILVCLQLCRGLFWLQKPVLDKRGTSRKDCDSGRCTSYRISYLHNLQHTITSKSFASALILFLANWVSQEEANIPNFRVDVIVL